jgi:hypothetical protein
MANLGDIVFINAVQHVDGETLHSVVPGIVTAVTDNEEGYGKGANMVTVTAFQSDGSSYPVEVAKADDSEKDDDGNTVWVPGTWADSPDGPGEAVGLPTGQESGGVTAVPVATAAPGTPAPVLSGGTSSVPTIPPPSGDSSVVPDSATVPAPVGTDAGLSNGTTIANPVNDSTVPVTDTDAGTVVDPSTVAVDHSETFASATDATVNEDGTVTGDVPKGHPGTPVVAPTE